MKAAKTLIAQTNSKAEQTQTTGPTDGCTRRTTNNKGTQTYYQKLEEKIPQGSLAFELKEAIKRCRGKTHRDYK